MLKNLEITFDHFQNLYDKTPVNFDVYNSRRVSNLRNFAINNNIQILVINIDSFAKDENIINKSNDKLTGKRPIEFIQITSPIVIVDEPQNMETEIRKKAVENLNPFCTLRYSATHTNRYNMVYSLDPVKAYDLGLVKQIEVDSIVTENDFNEAYLHLEKVTSTKTHTSAKIKIDVNTSDSVKRKSVTAKVGDDLYDLSNKREIYKTGYIINGIDISENLIELSNGETLFVGDTFGGLTDEVMKVQIRKTVEEHFLKERKLKSKGIKVLSLFFIDRVANYRDYNADGNPVKGKFAKWFEEICKEISSKSVYQGLIPFDAEEVHNGYFSADKKGKWKDTKGNTQADDDTFKLIMKNKEKLLDINEPLQFIFSHSALREGWDNPNVFNICQLKNLNYDNTITRRQELGRGLRLAVNQNGERMDNPLNVHQINVLTVVANESYKDFVKALLKETEDSLSARPKAANEDYFQGKSIKTKDGSLKIDDQMAKKIYRYLLKNDYTDDSNMIVEVYHEAKREGTLAELPEDLKPYTEEIHHLIRGVFSVSLLPDIEDGRKAKENPLNANFDKKEFQQLWSKINRKAVYAVDFDSNELIEKCVKALNEKGGLKISPLQYVIEAGTQTDKSTYENIKDGTAFKVSETSTETYNDSIKSSVRYDLIGQVSENTKLTRRTVASILKQMNVAVFSLYPTNPEDFIAKVSVLIEEQKATTIIEHLSYNPLDEVYDADIFTAEKPKEDFSKAIPVNQHIYDYVFTDSKTETKFVQELDTSSEVVVYAKLPRGFSIPTPVGSYNPDWAISFKQGAVKHVYFIAETKGTMSSLQLKEIENVKIKCAKKFFKKITSDQVKYDVVNSYEKLMQIVQV